MAVIYNCLMNITLNLDLQKYFLSGDFPSVCCVASQASFDQFSLQSIHFILISSAQCNQRVLFYYCVEYLLSQSVYCPQTLIVLSYYLPPEYGNLLATFEPRTDGLRTAEVTIPISSISRTSMYSRDGLFIRFSSCRSYPSIVTSISSQRVDVVICCWELSSNAMGRAYVLAEMLARDNYKVLVVAPSKGRQGRSLWPPLSRSTYSFEILTFAYCSEADFFDKALLLSRRIQADIVIASKTRPQSCLLTYLFGRHQNASLFCDIDDYESGFYGNTVSMKRWRDSIDLSCLNAFMDESVLFNDERWINVSSIIADTFDDYIFACDSMRLSYSNDHSPVVFHKRLPIVGDRLPVRRADGIYRLIFHGTIRKHKGINTLLGHLFLQCDSSFQVHLRLAAQPGLDDLLCQYTDNPYLTIEQIESLSIDNLSESLLSSDLLCLLQDVDSPVAQIQFPAKVADAAVLSLPILSTKTQTMLELSSAYQNIYFVEDFFDLKSAIIEILQMNDSNVVIKTLPSFSLLSNSLNREYFDSICTLSGSDRAFDEPICHWLNHRFGSKLSVHARYQQSTTRSEVDIASIKAPSFDVVMLWKQHDTFEYMRRHNSLLSAMSRSAHFNQLIHWEPPISRQQLFDLSVDNARAWSDAYKRYQGRQDTSNVHYRTYIYSQKPVELQQVQYRPLASFRDYFYRENNKYLSPQYQSLLWIYPPFFNFSLIHDALRYCKVVVDFVDNSVLESEDPSVEQYVCSQYKFLIANSHLCLVNCRGMFDFVSELGGEPLLIENGYPQRPSYQLRTDPISTQPEFVFIGNMNGRIDWDFVFDACRYYPRYIFKFYGASTINLRETSIPSNLSIFPPVTSEQAYAEILTLNSIGFFPFLNNRKTYYMNPIKFYEFRSLGIPIITTAHHNVPDIPGIFFANNIPLMDIQLSTILNHRKDGFSYLPSLDFYQKFSWDSRLNAIYSSLLKIDND